LEKGRVSVGGVWISSVKEGPEKGGRFMGKRKRLAFISTQEVLAYSQITLEEGKKSSREE